MEQQNNKRNIKRFTAFGETLTLVEWSKKSGADYHSLYYKVSKVGQSLEQTLKGYGYTQS